MNAFYDAWLAQGRSDPAAALQAVQRDWASSSDPAHAMELQNGHLQTIGQALLKLPAQVAQAVRSGT